MDDGASEEIAALAAQRPDIVSLGRLASVAAVVEPPLLRRLRLDVGGLARASVGTDAMSDAWHAGLEADLWFSELAYIATPSQMTLRPDVLEFLRNQLGDPRYREVAYAARGVVEEAHSAHTDMVRLEEHIIWSTIIGDTGAVGAHLARALATLRLGGDRAVGVIRWFMQARRRIPVSALTHPNGKRLLAAVAMHLDRVIPAEVLAADRFPDGVADFAPDTLPVTETGVVMTGNGVRFTAPDDAYAGRIFVPVTIPRVVEATWEDSHGEQHNMLVRADEGNATALPGLAGRAVLRTISGRRFAVSDQLAISPAEGKLADITGPDITERFGVTSTDLGASILAPNGKLVSIFGDTFSGRRTGEGLWRSPVLLIGIGDANHQIFYERAGGEDPNFARQLWDYVHDDASTGWASGGISSVIPSDLLRVDDSMYLHAIVNRGFGNVMWTEIWKSDDSGISWAHMGKRAEFPADLHGGYAQLWSWDYDPDSQWVYVVSTGFQRDKGIILRRVRPEDIGAMGRYSGWGWANNGWAWDNEPTPITPGGETWGELCLRRLERGKWVLGGFLSSKFALGYRIVDDPTDNLPEAPIQMPVVGSSWDAEDHEHRLRTSDRPRVAQLYGGYVLPGSRLDVAGGTGLVVSQWNTETGWPHRAMQFRVTLKDTTAAQRVGDPFTGHTGAVSSVAFSPDGRRLASASDDATVRLWDAGTGQPAGDPLTGHTDTVTSVTFSPDGTRLASGSWDTTVRLWDATTGQPVGQPLTGHTDTVTSVAFSPDGTRLASGSSDNTVRLWDADTGQPLRDPLTGPVRGVAFSPDGHRLATAGDDATVRLWNPDTGQLLRDPLKGHTGPVGGVAFSPDGHRLATAGFDTTVRLWNPDTGQPIGQPLTGHTAAVASVAFSPDARHIVSGSRDGTVRVWDAATGMALLTITGHTGAVASVAFSPDGRQIVSGSRDGTVGVWDASTGQPIGAPSPPTTPSR